MVILNNLIGLLDKPDDGIWGQYFLDDAEKIYVENHEILLPPILAELKDWPENRKMHLACILGATGTQNELKLISELLQSSNRHIVGYAGDALDEHNMVMRQQYLDEEYLKGHISFLRKGHTRFHEKLTEEIPDQHRDILHLGLIGKDYDILNSTYTFGLPVDSMRETAANLIEDHIAYVEGSSNSLAPSNILEQYIECTWVLSFAYFFKADKADVAKIIEHIPYTGKDKLIDRLIAMSIPDHSVSQEIVFPDVYKPLCDAMGVYEKEGRDILVNLFLTNYYPSLKKYDVTWYDSHKEKDPEYNFHTGYWVFELAALVVAIDWDDAAFRDNLYYPKDLVDWKRERSSS